LSKTLIGLAGLAFLLAVVVSLSWPIFGIPGETFSRACNNLALLAIGLAVCCKPTGSGT
jgi:hypothetical protein